MSSADGGKGDQVNVIIGINNAVSDSSIVTGLWISVTIGGVVLVLFCILQRYGAYLYRFREYDPVQKKSPVHVSPPALEKDGLRSLIDWAIKAITTPDVVFVKSAGLDALIMVKLCALGVQLFGPLCLVGVAVLIPVHWAGAESEKTTINQSGFMRITMSNLSPGSRLFWVHFVVVYLYIFWAMFLLKWHYHQYLIIRHVYLTKGEDPNEWRRLYEPKEKPKKGGEATGIPAIIGNLQFLKNLLPTAVADEAKAELKLVPDSELERLTPIGGVGAPPPRRESTNVAAAENETSTADGVLSSPLGRRSQGITNRGLGARDKQPHKAPPPSYLTRFGSRRISAHNTGLLMEEAANEEGSLHGRFAPRAARNSLTVRERHAGNGDGTSEECTQAARRHSVTANSHSRTSAAQSQDLPATEPRQHQPQSEVVPAVSATSMSPGDQRATTPRKRGQPTLPTVNSGASEATTTGSNGRALGEGTEAPDTHDPAGLPSPTTAAEESVQPVAGVQQQVSMPRGPATAATPDALERVSESQVHLEMASRSQAHLKPQISGVNTAGNGMAALHEVDLEAGGDVSAHDRTTMSTMESRLTIRDSIGDAADGLIWWRPARGGGSNDGGGITVHHAPDGGEVPGADASAGSGGVHSMTPPTARAMARRSSDGGQRRHSLCGSVDLPRGRSFRSSSLSRPSVTHRKTVNAWVFDGDKFEMTAVLAQHYTVLVTDVHEVDEGRYLQRKLGLAGANGEEHATAAPSPIRNLAGAAATSIRSWFNFGHGTQAAAALRIEATSTSGHPHLTPGSRAPSSALGSQRRTSSTGVSPYRPAPGGSSRPVHRRAYSAGAGASSSAAQEVPGLQTQRSAQHAVHEGDTFGFSTAWLQAQQAGRSPLGGASAMPAVGRQAAGATSDLPQLQLPAIAEAPSKAVSPREATEGSAMASIAGISARSVSSAEGARLPPISAGARSSPRLGSPSASVGSGEVSLSTSQTMFRAKHTRAGSSKSRFTSVLETLGERAKEAAQQQQAAGPNSAPGDSSRSAGGTGGARGAATAARLHETNSSSTVVSLSSSHGRGAGPVAESNEEAEPYVRLGGPVHVGAAGASTELDASVFATARDEAAAAGASNGIPQNASVARAHGDDSAHEPGPGCCGSAPPPSRYRAAIELRRKKREKPLTTEQRERAWKWWGFLQGAVADGRVAELPRNPRYSVVSSTFLRLFGDDFERAIPVINHKDVDVLLVQVDQHLAQYEYAKEIESKTGSKMYGRLGFCGLFGERVEWGAYHRKRVKDLLEEVQEARLQACESTHTRSWFVFFKSQRAATIASQCTLHSEDNRVFRAHPAPGPEDINWSALWSDYGSRELRHNLMRPLVALVVVFPIGIFTGGLMQLDYLLCPNRKCEELAKGSAEWAATGCDDLTKLQRQVTWDWYCEQQSPLAGLLRRLVVGWLPSLLINLWQGMILPLVFTFIVQASRQARSLSGADRAIAKYMFYFGVCNVFLGGVVGSTIIQGVNSAISKGPTEIFNLLGTYTPTSSNFFINYTMFRAFVAVPLRMLWPHIGIRMYLVRRWLRFNCNFIVTDREKAFLFAPTSPRYGFEVGMVLLIFVIAFAFAVVSPLILPMALFFFIIAWLFWRWALLYVYVRKYESGGTMWPFIFARVMVSMGIFALFTACVMVTKKAYIQAILLFVTVPVILIRFKYYCWYRFESGTRGMPLDAVSNAPEASVDPWVYIPPPLLANYVGWFPDWSKPWQGWNMPLAYV